MQREIKFRVRVEEEKKYYYFDLYDFDGTIDGEHGLTELGEIEIEMYTGSKDKNGKEIYEGDIVLIPSTYTDVITDDGQGPTYEEPQICEVKEKYYSFGVEIKNGDDLFDKGFYSFREIIKDIIGAEEIKKVEIIGNIHENPELIK